MIYHELSEELSADLDSDFAAAVALETASTATTATVAKDADDDVDSAVDVGATVVTSVYGKNTDDDVNPDDTPEEMSVDSENKQALGSHAETEDVQRDSVPTYIGVERSSDREDENSGDDDDEKRSDGNSEPIESQRVASQEAFEANTVEGWTIQGEPGEGKQAAAALQGALRGSNADRWTHSDAPESDSRAHSMQNYSLSGGEAHAQQQSQNSKMGLNAENAGVEGHENGEDADEPQEQRTIIEEEVNTHNANAIDDQNPSVTAVSETVLNGSKAGEEMDSQSKLLVTEEGADSHDTTTPSRENAAIGESERESPPVGTVDVTKSAEGGRVKNMLEGLGYVWDEDQQKWVYPTFSNGTTTVTKSTPTSISTQELASDAFSEMGTPSQTYNAKVMLSPNGQVLPALSPYVEAFHLAFAEK